MLTLVCGSRQTTFFFFICENLSLWSANLHLGSFMQQAANQTESPLLISWNLWFLSKMLFNRIKPVCCGEETATLLILQSITSTSSIVFWAVVTKENEIAWLKRGFFKESLPLRDNVRSSAIFGVGFRVRSTFTQNRVKFSGFKVQGQEQETYCKTEQLIK